NGIHRISARYAEASVNAAHGAVVSPRDAASGQAIGILVNDALPYDPMSVTFTDSQGRTIAVPIFGYSFGATQSGSWLRSGETYTMGVDSCGNNPNRSFKVTIEDVVLSSLTDPDGDGRYTGSFTYNSAVNAAGADAAGVLQLIAGAGSTRQSYGAAVQSLPTAIVRSRANAQPIAGAAVAALVAQATESAEAFYDLVAASVLGQANPALTGADGGYSFVAPAGAYRIDVAQSGYQPYRTGDIDVEEGALAVDVALAPVVAEAATHTVYMTANGFDPAVLKVQPGSVVEWVNLDLAEHGARHASAWDSGVLAAGARFKARLDAAGTFTYADVANPLIQGVIVVDSSAAAANSLFLPVVTR
ncbi:MAG: carboxypeptidase regulatory-like domain-containing protein, partial [Caldilinea sp.]